MKVLIMNETVKKILKLVFFIIFCITFLWLASFLFRFFMSYGNSGFLTKIVKNGFHLTDKVRSMPFDIIYYQKNYGETYIKQLKLAWIASGFVHGIILIVLVKLTTEKQKLYGDARFATTKEIEKSKLFIPAKEVRKDGLFADDKIIVGKTKNRYIALGGQQFVYLAAPTRSGKGVGVVIPVALSYAHSMVVLDIKQELFEITSVYRAKNGHKVYLFDPFNAEGKTSCWNPLSYVSRQDERRVDDLNQIAVCLIPDSKGDDNFFEESARKFFIGLGLYCLDKEKFYQQNDLYPFVPTIREILNLCTDFQGEAIPYFESLMTDEFVSAIARQTINSGVSAGDKTFSSILATLTANLTPWLSEPMVNATSHDDFDLREVRKQKMTIYIGIQPSDLLKASKIINLFFSQLINENTRSRPEQDSSLKYQCLLLMDEGTAPGKIVILEKAISYMAGYNLRILFIAQSPAQLKDARVYGEHGCKNILTNIALKIMYKPDNVEDSEELSKLLGKTTVTEDTSRSRGGGNNGVSRTETQNQRDLMMPQELRGMDKSKEIIIYSDIAYPIMAEKNVYYEDPVFIKRYQGQPIPTIQNLSARIDSTQKEITTIRQKIQQAKNNYASIIEDKVEGTIKSSIQFDVLSDFISTQIENSLEEDNLIDLS